MAPRTAANDQVSIFDLDPDDQPELDQDDLDNLDDQEIEASGDDEDQVTDQDDDGEGDDAGDDDHGGEPDPQPDSRQTQSRSSRRAQVLANENRELRRQQADFQRRLDELTRTVAQPRQQAAPRESQEQRAARRALMTSDERIEEDRREAEERHTRDMGLVQFQLRESSDRTSFEVECAADPLMRKWQPKVEAELANIRSQGQNVDRKQLFFYMIGKAAYEASRSPESRKQRRQAARRVRAQTVRPSNSRSDEAPAGGRRETTSREKRLENIQL